jgi:hypothetical protein
MTPQRKRLLEDVLELLDAPAAATQLILRDSTGREVVLVIADSVDELRRQLALIPSILASPQATRQLVAALNRDAITLRTIAQRAAEEGASVERVLPGWWDEQVQPITLRRLPDLTYGGRKCHRSRWTSRAALPACRPLVYLWCHELAWPLPWPRHARTAPPPQAPRPACWRPRLQPRSRRPSWPREHLT